MGRYLIVLPIGLLAQFIDGSLGFGVSLPVKLDSVIVFAAVSVALLMMLIRSVTSKQRVEGARD